MSFRPFAPERGATLIELAVVIALVGILGALIVNFVAPVRSYIDTTHRAALADAADTALRRIGRDLRLALPNSVRVNSAGGVQYLELLLVRTGGRYRYDTDPGATNTCSGGFARDVLAFGDATEDCFKTVGNLYSPATDISKVTTNDYLVVFNLQPGTANADAYEFVGTGGNKSRIVSAANFAGEDKITFTPNAFTYESPGNRFFIIEGAVSYVCDPAAKTLTRRWGYSLVAGAAATTTFTGGSSALMASGVSACTFTYDQVSQGTGLANLRLTLSTTDSRGSTENVTLYHAVHVSNVP